MAKYSTHCYGRRAKLVKIERIRKTIKTYYCPKCNQVYTEVVEE